MKKMVGVMVALVLVVPAATAQSRNTSRIYSNPAVPSREALERLNLTKAWHTYLPVDGRRDGFAMVQIFPDQILVQMRSGNIASVDPATGATQWRTRVGLEYAVIFPVGANSRYFFVLNADHMYVLDRRTGLKRWEYEFLFFPSSGPVADEERFYICLGSDRLAVYALPDLGDKPKPPPKDGVNPPVEEEAPLPESKAYGGRGLFGGQAGYLASAFQSDRRPPPGPQPTWQYDYVAAIRLIQRPVINEENILVVGIDGTIIATSKFIKNVQYRFRVDAPVSAALAQYEDMVYIPSEDFNLYALDMLGGRVVWKYVGGAALLNQPLVTDEDVYLSPSRLGLRRIQRATGEAVWTTIKAERFLSANPKYVYAMNRSNQLVILDRARGTEMGHYDTRDFVVPISNELTDRFYLASNDGLLVCLHDREYRTPIRMNKAGVKPPPKPKGDGDKAPPKPDGDKAPMPEK